MSRKELVAEISKARAQLEHILKATADADVLQAPDSPQYNAAMDRLIASLAKSIERRKKVPIHDDTPAALVQTSTHYEWATALQIADNERQLTRLISKRLRDRRIDSLFTLGGIRWKAKYQKTREEFATKPTAETEELLRALHPYEHIFGPEPLDSVLDDLYASIGLKQLADALQKLEAETIARLDALEEKVLGMIRNETSSRETQEKTVRQFIEKMLSHRHTTTINGTTTVTEGPITIRQLKEQEKD